MREWQERLHAQRRRQVRLVSDLLDLSRPLVLDEVRVWQQGRRERVRDL
jgi:hypothetical protein